MFDSLNDVERIESLALTLLQLAETYLRLGNIESALDSFKHAYVIMKKTDDPNLTADYGLKYVDHLMKHKNESEARRVLKDIEERYKKEFDKPKSASALFEPQSMTFELMKDDFKKTGKQPLELIRTRLRLALIDRRRGFDLDVVNNVPPLTDVYERIYGANTPELAACFETLGRDYHLLARESARSEEYLRAEELYSAALQIYNSICESADTRLIEAQKNLDQLQRDRQQSGA